MTIYTRLRERLRDSGVSPKVEGHWQVIRMCFDRDAGEWLNVGVLFRDASGQASYKLLGDFSKLQLLYDGAIDEIALRVILDDIATAIDSGGAAEGALIKQSEPLYASGDTAQQIVDEFYSDVVTLGRLGAPETLEEV